MSDIEQKEIKYLRWRFKCLADAVVQEYADDENISATTVMLATRPLADSASFKQAESTKEGE